MEDPHDESDDSGSSTPKARPQSGGALSSVPKLSIDGTDDAALSPLRTAPPPVVPTVRPSSPPAPLPTPRRTLSSAAAAARQQSAAQLMPPPSVRPSSLRPLPKLGGGLHPPPSAAYALRLPQPGSSLRAQANTSLTTSTLPPSKRASRKVELEPGHSPLDWAQLKQRPPTPTFLRGADVPPRLIKVLPSELRARNGRRGRDAWGTWQGKVYNLTPYMKFHPGGAGELMRGAGKAGTAETLFNEIHPWVSWDGMLAECLVGVLVSEEEAAQVNRLEEVD